MKARDLFKMEGVEAPEAPTRERPTKRPPVPTPPPSKPDPDDPFKRRWKRPTVVPRPKAEMTTPTQGSTPPMAESRKRAHVVVRQMLN